MTSRRPLRPEDLWLMRSAADVRWSPDGDTVAFTVTIHDRDADKSEPSVWVADAAGRSGDDGSRMFAAAPSHSARFSPDGQTIAFVAERDEGKGPQLHVASLSGGEPRAVTSQPHGVSLPVWSPDGQQIAYVARTGEAHDPERPRVVRHLRQRLDGFGWLDDRRSHIFVLDIETGVSIQLTDGDWDDDQPSWAPDGDTIVFVSDRSADRFDRPFHRDVYALSGGEVRRLSRGRGDAMEAHVSPDGTRVAYVGGESGDDVWSAPTDLLVVPLDGRDSEPVSLASPFDVHAGSRFLAAGRQLAWMDDKRLAFVGPYRGGLALFEAAADGSSVVDLVAGDRSIMGFDVRADGCLAFPSVWIDEPSEVWMAEVPGQTPRAITSLNADLKAVAQLAPGRRITSTTADGTVTESFLVSPPEGVAAKCLVLDIHGGPHGMNPGTSAGGWLAIQAAAANGYSVLLPNPRGSAGYGRKLLAGCVGDWGGGDADDLLAAVDAVEAELQPERTYVWGYSFGGFMATWLVGHTDRFRAAVVGAPVIDLVSMLGTTDIPSFTAHEVGGYPWDAADAYAKHSPLTYAADIATPVLLLHHEGDLRCPVGQSEQLFTTLRLLGREVELVRYPGGFHGVAKPSFVIDRTQRVVDWFAAHP